MRDNRGNFKVKAVIWILIGAFLVYGSVKFVPMYFKYIMMHYELRTEVKQAHLNPDHVIMKHIMEKAKHWDLPVNKERVRVSRGYDTIQIEVRYDVLKSFFGGRKKQVYNFVINKEGELKSTDYR